MDLKSGMEDGTELQACRYKLKFTRILLGTHISLSLELASVSQAARTPNLIMQVKYRNVIHYPNCSRNY